MPDNQDSNFEPAFANVADAVKITRLSKATLCRMRMHKSADSPPWFRAGGRVLYPLSGLSDWATARVNAASAGCGAMIVRQKARSLGGNS